MKTIVQYMLLISLVFCTGGCAAPKIKNEASPIEVRQAVAVAFGLHPEASLPDVLGKIENDVQLGSTPEQVTTYLGEVKKRSSVAVNIMRSQRGRPIVRNVITKETITAYFIDSFRVYEVSVLFVFDDADRLEKIDYSKSVWER